MKRNPHSRDPCQTVVDYKFVRRYDEDIAHENGSFGTTAKSVIKPATYDLNFGHTDKIDTPYRHIQDRSLP